MRRPGKFVIVVALAGLMLAGTVGIALHGVGRARPGHADARARMAEGAASGPATRDLTRCRTLTMPDSGCEAAWEARRRHFFETR